MDVADKTDSPREHLMTWKIKATFDGTIFRPDEPVTIPPDTRVVLIVEPEPPPKLDSEQSVSFFDIALSLSIDGPSDWSARVDHYLYGPMVGDDNDQEHSGS